MSVSGQMFNSKLLESSTELSVADSVLLQALQQQYTSTSNDCITVDSRGMGRISKSKADILFTKHATRMPGSTSAANRRSQTAREAYNDLDNYVSKYDSNGSASR